MKIGFIGLGNMGMPIAQNLLKAGHKLTAFNRTRSKTDQLRPFGAQAASTPAEAANDCEILITMLSDDNALEKIIFAPGNCINSLCEGAIHISMSTISVSLSKRLAEIHNAKRQHYIAAPVFGQPELAEAAKLFIIAGGSPEKIKFCQPLFDAIGQKTIISGEQPYTANVIKLAGNFLIMAAIESMAESMAFVRKFGLDGQTFTDFIASSVMKSPVYQTYGNLIVSEEFQNAGFKLHLGFKDNRLLIAGSEEAAVPMPLASLLHDRFVAAIAQGLSDCDWAAIARISEQSAELKGVLK